ncbi:MAG: NAD-dependent epimerase/dehydratase family protein [Candidatus Aenigmarchaeota archaeon]|nr:NAD-dependent epimerase/dehydratase family protein [Candidatus Aenigmarchaeota archaeon]
MVNILVTGGGGFIGRELVKALAKQRRNKITVFERNINNRIPGVEYIRGDITISEDVKRAVKGKDYVYHLAAIIDETCPKKIIFDINVGGTISVLEACRKEKVKKLIYLSTAGVITETMNQADEKTSYGPRTNYERSKALAEKTAIEYYKRHRFPVVIIRPALLYGPNAYWNVILREAQKVFPLIGSGKNKWHMLYIKNLIPVLVNVKTRGKDGNVYIIADDEVYTYEEMYCIIREKLDIKRKPVHIPVWFAKFIALLYMIAGKKSIVNKDHIDRLIKNKWYNISKAKRQLKYSPKYNFNKGIRETIKYFRDEGLLKR